MAEEEDKKKKICIIVTKGTLDAAYPPLILATTAASMDWEANIFFTFYGLDIINKKKYKNLKVAPIANPAMPMPVPNIIGMLPGMTGMATMMMKNMMKKANVPDIEEFINMCKEMGVKFYGCQMTLDVMGVKEEDLIPTEACIGAAAFLDIASDADVTLLV
ncbi:MAG TPA: peroxiredoxin family protein [Euryarchaeota archaeon]|nr:DsrE/DsrF-like family protein [archaeon BMS3Bbin15]HDL15863.1 peroxiredoxin family protein [Euryarchaeota archaeon]